MTHTYTIDTVDALDRTLSHTPVDQAQVADASPTVGHTALFTVGGDSADEPCAATWQIGIWEMSAGAMYDVEIDEVFVVLRGDAEIAVLDASGLVAESIPLRPGVVCRLHAGTRTRWTVRRALRKMYISAS